MVFRDNTEGLWEELLQRAQGLKTRYQSEKRMRDFRDCDIQFF